MIRRRRSEQQEPQNLERWLISYADFITLLFAFFVVMYAISSLNEGKYRVLSESISSAFRKSEESPARSLDPIQVGELQRSDALETLPLPDPAQVDERQRLLSEARKQLDAEKQLAETAKELDGVLAPYIDDKLIDVKRNGLWIEIEMRSGLLFGSGSAQLAADALPLLAKLADVFRKLPNAIHVEGYTDDRPINTREFPSNWELSSARAASVVHRLMTNGVEPHRMAAIGYGEYHPLTDNADERGRYQNRRVVIVLQAVASARHPLGPNERLEADFAPAGVVPPVSNAATGGAQ